MSQNVLMDFCAHDEGTDDVGPIRDEVQSGCSTTESVLGMVHSADRATEIVN